MPIEQIHAFLVHPEKGKADKSILTGTAVPLSGKMYDLVNAVYQRSESECNIEINFRSSGGKQQNDCRDVLLKHLRDRNLTTATALTERLRDSTDGRSGLGLLFLIAGTEGTDQKLVISRFPTDSAIFVDEGSSSLTVEFLERVFMKNKTSYKAAAYLDNSLIAGFWTGRAIDKQVNDQGGQVSDYWITGFLQSEFKTTPAAGSRRFGRALKEAVKNAPLEIKQELIAAGTLANGLAGKAISIDSVADQFSLSRPAREALVGALKNPNTASEQFTFDISQFRNYVEFRSVELDNGGMLSAGLAEFDDVFQQRPLDKSDGTVEFSTRGKVVNDKLKATR